eukprot:120638-Pyramimonas_sp.AAC.2
MESRLRLGRSFSDGSTLSSSLRIRNARGQARATRFSELDAPVRASRSHRSWHAVRDHLGAST